MTVPAPQPIGQLSQMPTGPRRGERMKASPTRSIRSENVEIMNGIMSPLPLRTASVIIFTETMI